MEVLPILKEKVAFLSGETSVCKGINEDVMHIARPRQHQSHFFPPCLLFFITAVTAKVAGRDSYSGDSDKRVELKWRRNEGRRCHGDSSLFPSPHPIVVSRSRSNWL